MMKTLAPAAIALAALAGCASITDGTTQTLIIPVQPREARCSVMRNDVELGTITGSQQTITISKGARDVLVTCNAPGYLQKVSRLVSSTQTEGMMSFLFLDLGITDMVTGAMWKYPQSTSIMLERDPSTSSPVVPAPVAAAPNVLPGNIISARSVEPGAPTPPEPSGKDAYVADRVARNMACSGAPGKMIGKGPGFESYSFQCLSGEMLVIRCEMGTCRALQ
jgi:hypothetical protein